MKYIHEPTPLQCGQAVLAMICGEDVEKITNLLNNERETTLKEMFFSLDHYGILYNKERKQVTDKTELPRSCILSLETPRCWHWSLYHAGIFYDPEHGISDDFPVSDRRYYWEIQILE